MTTRPDFFGAYLDRFYGISPHAAIDGMLFPLRIIVKYSTAPTNDFIYIDRLVNIIINRRIYRFVISGFYPVMHMCRF